MNLRLVLLSALLAISSSPISAQKAVPRRTDSTVTLQRRTVASDSADAAVWRRFRIGAAVGFAIGATAGILVQQRGNERATDGIRLSPLFTGVVFGIPSAVLGGVIAARWPR